MTTTLPILLFHSLDDRASAISFFPAAFRQLMAKLHARGHRTLSLPEAVRHVRAREQFPPAAFVITFDDGYRSVYTEAFPVLQEFDFSAALFIATGVHAPADASVRLPAMESRPMLSWKEIKEMQRCGVVVGSHTLTHPDLTRLPAARIEDEVTQSKQIIEDKLGVAVGCFAYPFGYHDRRCREIVRQHFDCACSTQLGLVGMNSDLHALERVETYYLRGGNASDLMSSPLFPAYLAARRLPRLLRQTFVRWGGA